MELTFDFWNIIPLLGAAQGIFLGFIFLFLKRGNPLANRLLGTLILIFSLRLLGIVAFWTKFLIVFPHFSLVGFPLSYLIGVILFYSCKHLITGERKLDTYFWLHLIPFILVIIYIIPYYLLDSEIKLRIIKNSFYSETPANISDIPTIRTLTILLQFPHAFLYTFLSLKFLNKFTPQEEKFQSKIDSKQLTRLRKLVLGFGFFFSAWLFYNIIIMLGFKYNISVDRVITIAMTVFIYTIGYFTFNSPEIYLGMVQKKPAKYESSTLTNDVVDTTLKGLNQLMIERKFYRNNKLRLSDLANELNISSHHLSQIINDQLDQNFYDFVNRYRIEETKKILLDPKSKKFTLLGIAFEVGFNNKTSFNNSFKKYTGITPTEYITTMRKKK